MRVHRVEEDIGPALGGGDLEEQQHGERHVVERAERGLHPARPRVELRILVGRQCCERGAGRIVAREVVRLEGHALGEVSGAVGIDAWHDARAVRQVGVERVEAVAEAAAKDLHGGDGEDDEEDGGDGEVLRDRRHRDAERADNHLEAGHAADEAERPERAQGPQRAQEGEALHSLDLPEDDCKRKGSVRSRKGSYNFIESRGRPLHR